MTDFFDRIVPTTRMISIAIPTTRAAAARAQLCFRSGSAVDNVGDSTQSRGQLLRQDRTSHERHWQSAAAAATVSVPVVPEPFSMATTASELARAFGLVIRQIVDLLIMPLDYSVLAPLLAHNLEITKQESMHLQQFLEFRLKPVWDWLVTVMVTRDVRGRRGRLDSRRCHSDAGSELAAGASDAGYGAQHGSRRALLAILGDGGCRQQQRWPHQNESGCRFRSWRATQQRAGISQGDHREPGNAQPPAQLSDGSRRTRMHSVRAGGRRAYLSGRAGAARCLLGTKVSHHHKSEST